MVSVGLGGFSPYQVVGRESLGAGTQAHCWLLPSNHGIVMASALWGPLWVSAVSLHPVPSALCRRLPGFRDGLMAGVGAGSDPAVGGGPSPDTHLSFPSQAWAPLLCTRVWHLHSRRASGARCPQPTSLCGTPSRASWWSFPAITCLTSVRDHCGWQMGPEAQRGASHVRASTLSPHLGVCLPQLELRIPLGALEPCSVPHPWDSRFAPSGVWCGEELRVPRGSGMSVHVGELPLGVSDSTLQGIWRALPWASAGLCSGLAGCLGEGVQCHMSLLQPS